MKIFVTVKPKSRNVSVQKIDATHFRISIKEAPEGGRANEGCIKALADYFDCAPSYIKLISGFSSRKKVFEVPSQ